MDLASAAYSFIFLLSVALLYVHVTGRNPTRLAFTHLSIFLLLSALLYSQITTRIPTRFDANQAPASRFELVPVGANGLPTLASGVDIVFVHGLGSNPDTTWRARRPATTANTSEEAAPGSEQFINWVSGFLPDDIPPTIRKDVRMFFYNYDSYWKRDAVHTRLTNLGNEILEHINGGIRMSEAERSRDLIFVAYSYGGLVVKQALVQAHANRDFGHVVEHTKAILFLGTPHRGSSFSTWGWLVAQALQPLGSNPLILANLEYDSTSLLDLHRAFAGIARDDLYVFNFFEQRPAQIFRLWFIRWQQFCVREQSATYDGPKVRNIGLPVDHYGLNKFGSRSESYRVILSKLLEVTTSSSRPVKHYYAVPLQTSQEYIQRDELWTELDGKLRTRHETADVPYAVAIHGLGGADRYNPILWIDATDEQTVRSSFERCAAELGIPDSEGHRGSTFTEAGAVQAVLRWLRDRTEADDEWLVIVDNADNLGWGIKKITPKGERGSVIITSQDSLSSKLVRDGCEQIRVGVMSPREATILLLQHLQLDINSAPQHIRKGCENIAQRLGYLALAIDLAGAYIGAAVDPEKALARYLIDYDAHRDELLQMDMFRGLRPTEKTIWTVWDQTLQKITTDYSHLQPDMLLIFLAHFKGTIIQDEIFRLAALGSSLIGNELVKGIPNELRQILKVDHGEWDNFSYEQSRDVLQRYSLLQRVKADWAGLTMHNLLQWRVMQSNSREYWRWGYIVFITATCRQVIEQQLQPEFRRHLMAHLPELDDLNVNDNEHSETEIIFILDVLGRVYYDEGRWKDAEKLWVQVMETRKTMLGVDHPVTLGSTANLAATYRNLGRWKEAEQIMVQIMEISKTKFGADHPDTLNSMAHLATVYKDQGQWDDAEKLEVQVMETRKTIFGVDHPYTLSSMSNLASTYRNLGRWKEAEKLGVQVMGIRKAKLGVDHPDTLNSMANLAVAYISLGRWKDAEELGLQVVESRKLKLGADHPDTLHSMVTLSSIYREQGRWDDAEKLDLQTLKTYKTKLGVDHPDTLLSMHNLAHTWKGQGRHEEALALMKNCAKVQQQVLSQQHSSTLSTLAWVKEWSK